MKPNLPKPILAKATRLAITNRNGCCCFVRRRHELSGKRPRERCPRTYHPTLHTTPHPPHHTTLHTTLHTTTPHHTLHTWSNTGRKVDFCCESSRYPQRHSYFIHKTPRSQHLPPPTSHLSYPPSLHTPPPHTPHHHPYTSHSPPPTQRVFLPIVHTTLHTKR